VTAPVGTAATASAAAKPRVRKYSLVKVYGDLFKARLNALVVVSAAAGYLYTGGSSFFTYSGLASLLLGVTLTSFGAAGFNQIMEREYDKKMIRCARRPLVTGAISVRSAAIASLLTGAAGVATLAVGCNEFTAALGLFNALYYVLLYTPLKRVTKFNTEIGAVCGAIPPMMGWTAIWGRVLSELPDYTPSTIAYAASMSHALDACFLGAFLWIWQIQHFMTIAYRYKQDYERAGYKMWSEKDYTGHTTARYGLFWCAVMCGLPFLGHWLGFTSGWFMLFGSIPNVGLLLAYLLFYANPTPKTSKLAMVAGFLHMIVFFGFLLACMTNRPDVTPFIEPLKVTAWQAYCTVMGRDAKTGQPLKRDAKPAALTADAAPASAAASSASDSKATA